MDTVLTIGLLLFGAGAFLWPRAYWLRVAGYTLWYWLRGVDSDEPAAATTTHNGASGMVLDYSPRGSAPLPVAPAVQRAPTPPLPTTDWLTILNNRPDAVPHLLIKGGSGSGKTTFTRALLSGRSGSVVILTPKEEDEPLWSVPIITTDQDGTFTTIAAALDWLQAVLMQRAGATDELTVVLDDYALIAGDSACKAAARELLLRVARIGRSRRMRLLVLADVSNAASLGIVGEAASLNNFAVVEIDRSRAATLTIAGETAPLDMSRVQDLAALPLMVQGALMPTDDADGRTDGRTDGPKKAQTDTIVRPSDKESLVRFLVRECGWNTTQIRETIRGENAALGELVRSAQE